MSSFSTINIDSDGDLTLVLRSEATHAQLHELAGETLHIRLNLSNWSHLHIRVSSKHLSLASRVFKAMLASNFQEGQQLRATGSAQIDLHDDNAVALYMVLSILHCKAMRVPTKVGIDILVAIAIIVDKYELHEAVEPYAAPWLDYHVEALGANFRHCPENLFLDWICVTWVFKKYTAFQEITRAATERSPTVYVATENLPIPSKILGTFFGLIAQAL